MTRDEPSRIWTWEDQQEFAQLSGDYNPMHMDAEVARRTQAGGLVVHGINNLLWLLEFVTTTRPDLAEFSSIRVKFEKLVYVGDRVSAVVEAASPSTIRVAALVNGVSAVRVVLSKDAPAPSPIREPGRTLAPTFPVELSMSQMSGQKGYVEFASEPEEAFSNHPGIVSAFGGRRIAALLATTRLVGMVCPGLHSIYAGLNVRVTEDDGARSLYFNVSRVDERFRSVRLDVAGGGLTGTLETMVRAEPVSQPSYSEVNAKMQSGIFSNMRALVVGGSRGIGELTSKLLAAGGADVALTYATGRSDAEAVVADIRSGGGSATCLPYDIRLAAKEQLSALPFAPTHFLYMATPHIAKRKKELYDPQRLREFLAFYVDGFWAALQELQALSGDLITFYPSTVFVAERPENMTEYSMAKAAGEILCADINEQYPSAKIIVARLPRLPSDQTSSLKADLIADPFEVLLPLLVTLIKR